MDINPSWEDMMVNKIKSMLVTEQGLVLETICLFLEKHGQVGSETDNSPLVGQFTEPERKSGNSVEPVPSHHVELINYHSWTPRGLGLKLL